MHTSYHNGRNTRIRAIVAYFFALRTLHAMETTHALPTVPLRALKNTNSKNDVSGVMSVIGCLHDRANIEQLARRSMVISMLIRRAGGL